MQQSRVIEPIKHPPLRFHKPQRSWKRKLNKKVTQYRIKTILPPPDLVTVGW